MNGMNKIADLIGDVIRDVTGEDAPRLILPPGQRAVGPFVQGEPIQIVTDDEDKTDDE